MSGQALAIVGRGCILPGARTPAELWHGVLAGRVWIGEPPGGPLLPGAPFSQAGGYVADESGGGEDPLTRWLLAAARAALAEAGGAGGRTAAVFGHLSLPTRSFARFAESVWLDTPGPSAESRFMSGLPIQRVARALGADAGVLALDAACASSLYAIKIARDWLEDGRADLVLAGGVNAADPLFLHHGFHALRASSPSGRSRPFDKRADGLVPAEGAACVALKRLADAERAGDRILGVIRGIGLTNDGGGQALLAPSRAGQVAAMRQAYADAGIDPASVQLVECHATGTPVGDAAEVESMRQVFAGSPGLAVSSLKANTGHLLTASGAAGLLKVLAAMEAGVLPPTPGVDAPLPGLDGRPLRVLHAPAPWPDAGPRRAAISAFGFGGNNAHVVVEQWLPPRPAAAVGVARGQPHPSGGWAETKPQPPTEVEQSQSSRGLHRSLPGSAAAAHAVQETKADTMPPPPAEPQPSHGLAGRAPRRGTGPAAAEIAVVGVGCVVGPHGSRAAFERVLFRGPAPSPAPMETVSVRSDGLRFPPNDLAQALPQQLAILQAAQEAVADAGALPAARTSVLVGMQCDPEIARHVTWLRLPEAAASRGGPLTAPAVVGLLPNLPANRLNNHWNLGGPSFTVSAEELSGISALGLAARALRAGEVDAALVGAVDMCCEPVHAAAAAAALAGPRTHPGDAAAVLVLKRLEDARRDGSRVYAIVRDEGPADLEIGLDDLAPRFGHAHAASGLLHVAAAALACSRGALPDGSATPWLPAGGPRRAAVTGTALGGMSARVVLEEPEPNLPAVAAGPLPRLHVYAAADAAELARALAEGREGGHGEARAVLVAAGATEVVRGRERALKIVREGSSAADEDGVHVRLKPLSGQLALVFTGAATAYAGMGRELCLAFPDLLAAASARLGSPRSAAGWIYHGGDADPLAKLAGSSLLCQVHADLSTRVLGLRPDAAIGLSSGETNALVALGAWRDVGGLFDDLRREGLYDRELGGELRALRRAWGVRGEDPVSWRAWRVLRPVAEVRAAVAGEPRVALTMVHTERDCVIGGEAEACVRVLRRLGGGGAVPLEYDFAVHCPEVAEVAAIWRAIHRRPTAAVPGVRFYGAAGGAGPVRDADQVADALLGMAGATVDWPAMVRHAWDDGVRVFVEHGPRGLCTGWIGEILADRPHLAVALDRPGRDGVRQAAEAVAALVAAGVDCDWRAFDERLAASDREPGAETGPVLRFPAHPPRIDPPASAGMHTYEVMAPAPEVAFVAPTGGWVAPAPGLEVMEGAPVVGGSDESTAEVGRSTATEAPLPVRGATVDDGIAARMAAARAAAPAQRPGVRLPSHAGRDGLPAGVAAAPTPRLAAGDRGQGAPLPVPAPAPHAGGPAVPVPVPVPESAPHDGALARVAAIAPSPHGNPGVAAPVLAALIDSQRRLSEVHRTYLALQNEVHGRFMELQRGASARAMAGAQLVAVPAPVPQKGPGVLAAGVQPPTAPPPVPQKDPGASADLPAELQPSAAPAPVAQHDPGASARRTAAVPPVPASPVRAFSRQQLEQLAGGRISDVFGPQHGFQDGFRRQVRLPLPPLLLPDRVISLEGEPCSMGRGVIVTETDVPPDAWYVHDGHVTPGILVESGQSDLLLISWLGIDAHNRGERVYRLLGCELTFHGAAPRGGETLRYRIEVVGHARHGDMRLFFFRYDCTANGRPVLSVREGQAGFFSDEELAGSAGVLWDPATAEHRTDGPLDPPAVDCGRRRFDRDALDAFTDGRLADCFGPALRRASTQVRPPRIPGGMLRLLDRVTDFDPMGGPWGRGYLRAETDLRGDEWFFPCHFKDDPVMPGTLMAEGCVQAMAFYLSAMGFSLGRDGWRFEPVPEEAARMVCRGQVLPSSRHMVYELFVEDVSAGPVPTLHADLLLTVDGLKVFHGRRMGVRLVPGWPLAGRPELLAGVDESRPVETVSGVRQDERALLACAWGAPTAAFGAPYRAFDAGRRLPRLPGPPYLFVSRVLRVTGTAGTAAAGTEVEVEYDIPRDAWYFGAAGGGRMPFSVLLEAALQPCGWLTAYMGIPLASGQDLFFRNLDGRGTVQREVGPGDRTLTTRVRTSDVSRMGDTVIERFHVECLVGEEPVYTLDTVFGHFPAQALGQQVGLPPTPEEAELMAAPANADEPLPGPARAPLLMLDRLTGWWPENGRVRAEKRVDAGEWFFKAHFFQDPVQPGSLGIEAMLQLLQAYMARSGQAGGRFEAIERDRLMVWKYRGQVLPEDGVVAVGLQITESGADFARADGTLWVDGRLIYRATGLGMRIVPSDGPTRLDPAVDTWVLDHRPTFAAPVLPLMSLIDRMAAAAKARWPGRVVAGVRAAEVRRWVTCDRPRELRVDLTPTGMATLYADGEVVATAEIEMAEAYPEAEESPLPPLVGAREAPDPYASGALFHGPAFQLLRSLRVAPAGAAAVLAAASRGVPCGCLNQALLDAATHAIAHDELVPDAVAYPIRVPAARFYGPPPTSGEVRCEVRAEAGAQAPAFAIQLWSGERLWCSLHLIEVLVPKGPLGRLPRADRVRFLRDRLPVPGAGLTTAVGGETHLQRRDLLAADWLPGSVAAVYDIVGEVSELGRTVAAKEHVARHAGVHPSAVRLLAPDAAVAPNLPLHRFPVAVEDLGDSVRVRDAGPPRLDAAGLRAAWRRIPHPVPGEDVFLALAERFVRRVELADPEAWAGLGAGGRVYLANHQTGIESALFCYLLGGLSGSPVVGLAKAEHRFTWLGGLVRILVGPEAMLLFERQDPASMLGVLEGVRAHLAEGISVLVHVEGTRSLRAGQPVARVSASLIDAVLACEAPVVPVRFSGGLPRAEAPNRLEFPLGYGTQDYHIGAPIAPGELAPLALAERRDRILGAINRLGPRDEAPHAPDPDLGAEVEAWVAATGAERGDAVVRAALRRFSDPGPLTRRLLSGDDGQGAMADLARRIAGHHG